MIKVAIIGGTGHKIPDNLERLKSSSIATPYGMPCIDIYTGQVDGRDVVYLSRLGIENPLHITDVNYMANFYALKDLGCEVILSTSECASLQEEICPGDFIIPDQFIDFTNNRINGIHDDDNTEKMSRKNMANPFSDELRDHLTEAAIVQGITVHNKGTVITVEGCRHPTKAESNLYRKWGGDIIDMTTSLEVLSAMVMEVPLAQVSLCTAYDNWRNNNDEEHVLHYAEIIKSGYEKIRRIIDYAISRIQENE